MQRDRGSEPLSEFLRYLAGHIDSDHSLPALTDLSQEIGLSVATLREQLEVARALGLVEVRPRTGMRRLPYTFLPAVRQSLNYAIALDGAQFERFADLRRHVESAYWQEAIARLTGEDLDELRALVARAWEKLRGTPIQIPHPEHRALHLAVFRRIENPFALAILEAYWEAYEAVGLNVYADYHYLQEVWTYHQKMVDAVCAGDAETGYQALAAHAYLIHQRPPSAK
jgi:DNA-binding FadR family transcriptional regulator